MAPDYKQTISGLSEVRRDEEVSLIDVNVRDKLVQSVNKEITDITDTRHKKRSLLKEVCVWSFPSSFLWEGVTCNLFGIHDHRRMMPTFNLPFKASFLIILACCIFLLMISLKAHFPETRLKREVNRRKTRQSCLQS